MVGRDLMLHVISNATFNEKSAMEAEALYIALEQYLSGSFLFPENKTKHIIIVGGGIVGLTCAFYLQQLAYRVTVLEEKSFGAGASGRNTGGILTLGRDLTEVPFARMAIKLWQELEGNGIETKLVQSGHVMIAKTSEELVKLDKAKFLYELAGLEVQTVDKEALKQLLPDLGNQIIGGIYTPIDAQNYPFIALKNLKKYLRDKDVRLISHCKINSFETDRKIMTQVTTTKGKFQGDVFLFCTGAWTNETFQLFKEYFPISRRKAQAVVIENIQPNAITPFVTGNSLYIRQLESGQVIVGRKNFQGNQGISMENTTSELERITNLFLELFPTYSKKVLLRTFAGTLDMTEDKRPYFGNISSLENVFISAGYNGQGYGIAPVIGKLMACFLTENLRKSSSSLKRIFAFLSKEI